MSIRLAPTELLHQIFLYLPKSNLLNCAMVCQCWKLPALQLFYENVELSEKTKKVWLHMVQTPTAINVGSFVRKLTVSLAFSTTLSQGDFLKVISYLPFLRSVDLNSSGYKLHYLAYLIKRDAGCVTYLEDIYTGDLFTNYQIQQYFLCAYSFRHSLKKLTLRNPFSVYQMDGQTGDALFFLNQFANLTHLIIIDEIHLGENEVDVLMDAIQSCSKLVSLSYQNTYSLPYSQEDSQQAKKRSMKNTKLQTVALNVSNLTSIYITHMLRFFPACLDMLTINMVDTDYCDWIQENIEFFAPYFGRVKNLKVSTTNANNRRSFMDRKSQRIQNSPSRFGQFICSLMGNRQLNVQITFIKAGSRPDIAIEKDQQNMLLSYNIENMADFRACLEELSLIYLSSPVFPSTIIESLVAKIPFSEKNEFDYGRCMEIIKSITLLPYPPKSVSVMCQRTNPTDGIPHLNQLVLYDNFWDINPNNKQDTMLYSDIPTFDTLEGSNAKLINCQMINKMICIRADGKIVLATFMLNSITAT